MNFPKPLDKEALKQSIAERSKNAREAAAAEKAAQAEKPVEKKEENNA